MALLFFRGSIMTMVIIEGWALIIAVHLVVFFCSMRYSVRSSLLHTSRTPSHFVEQSQIEYKVQEPSRQTSERHLVMEQGNKEQDSVIVVSAESLRSGREGHFIGTIS